MHLQIKHFIKLHMSCFWYQFQDEMFTRKPFKKAVYIFWIQVGDFNISEIFLKIPNLKKWKMKAVLPFLPRNPNIHSACVRRQRRIRKSGDLCSFKIHVLSV